MVVFFYKVLMSLLDILTIQRASGPQEMPLVIDVPHAGTWFPDDAPMAGDRAALAAAHADTGTDALCARAPSFGATCLIAKFARLYVDANRAADDMVGLRPSEWGKRGHGVVWTHGSDGAFLYESALDTDVIAARLRTAYHPYHMILSELISAKRQKFGSVIHLNLHSMPAQSAPDMDVVLGDRDGESCAPKETKRAKLYLESLGLKVALNTPYRGAEIVRKNGQPRAGIHSLQVEINRKNYLNADATIDPVRLIQWQQIVAEMGVTIAAHLPGAPQLR